MSLKTNPFAFFKFLSFPLIDLIITNYQMNVCTDPESYTVLYVAEYVLIHQDKSFLALA